MLEAEIKNKIKIAHSVDADDAFMFYALSRNIITSINIQVEHILKDIQTLNTDALNNVYDVQAISFFAYPDIEDRYQLLSCGGSLGYGYGPMLIAKKGTQLKDIVNKKIVIPGKKTTAYLLLKLYLKDFEAEILPFDEIVSAVSDGKYEAGLIIHEAQLSYVKFNLQCLVDLGKWWLDETSLPVPLGANVIRRSFNEDLKKEVNSMIRESIKYALENKNEVVKNVTKYARDIKNDTQLVDRFIEMYVNKYSIDYGFEGKVAIETLYKRAYEARLIAKIPKLDFVE